MNLIRQCLSKQTRQKLRLLYYRITGSKPIYKICWRYVTAYEGNCDHDMVTNGEFNILKQALSLASEGDIIIDVGAHVGIWARQVLKLNPDLYVHCFEPSPRNFQVLAQQDALQSACLNPIALGEKKGLSTFFLNKSYSQQDSFYPVYDQIESKLEVQVETLMDYCSDKGIRHIYYLKIDAEGSDLEVLEGARDLLAQNKIDFVQFEYGPKNIYSRVFLRDILNFWSNYEYTLYKIKPYTLTKVVDYMENYENFLLSNFVAISNILNFSYKI